MDQAALEAEITRLWDDRATLSPATGGAARASVEAALDLLDSGVRRVAEPGAAGWVVNEWLKKAVLLSFRLTESTTMAGPGGAPVYDKVPMKFDGWGDNRFREAGFRVVPGSVVRRSAFVAPGVVLMPCFVNVGAHVGKGSMIDTWATVGSCAQVGANCHISGGVGIGGVLEPPQAAPVVVGDDSMIGSRCIVAEGARVGNGVVLGAGCILTGSIPVIDAESGNELSRGVVPDWCVAISATRTREYPGGTFGLPCVLVVKRLNEGERHDKSKLNDILRDHGAAT